MGQNTDSTADSAQPGANRLPLRGRTRQECVLSVCVCQLPGLCVVVLCQHFLLESFPYPQLTSTHWSHLR